MKTLLLAAGLAALAFGLDTAYVHKVSAPFAIDGAPDISTRDYPPLHDFIFPWGNDRGTKSSVWLAWNDSGLYLYAILHDTHLVASVTSGTGIDGDDMLEIHMAPDVNLVDYFYITEFNMNLVTRSRIRHSRPTGANDWSELWDIAGIERTILKHGTPNNQGDLDSSWIVEMLVPFSEVAGWQCTQHTAPAGWAPAAPPSEGSVWGFNASRQNQNVADDPLADWSIWSHNGSFPYGTGMDGVHLHDHNNFGRLVFSGPVGVKGGLRTPPAAARLAASPNPFSSRVRFSALDGAALDIFTPAGRLVESLRLSGGEAVWDAANARSGLYFARLKNGQDRLACRLMLMR